MTFTTIKTTFSLSATYFLQGKFKDTKGVIRIRKSKKDRQYNGQQALRTLPKHLSSPLVFSGIRVAPFARASVFCFVHHYLSFCPFSFAHCIVYPSFAHCIVYPSFAH
jgi:hypothetical protein